MCLRPTHLNVDSAEAARLAEELTELLQQPLDEVVLLALRSQLVRERRKRGRLKRLTASEKKKAAMIAERFATPQVFDDRLPPEREPFDSIFYGLD